MTPTPGRYNLTHSATDTTRHHQLPSMNVSLQQFYNRATGNVPYRSSCSYFNPYTGGYFNNYRYGYFRR